ncbi:hypothetical protein FOA52_011529 [Chlamydomonas sp. UWO 241]|nr:hypothetical protein FOA52_011529 [Chlamydomonas sp. UWO 241]
MSCTSRGMPPASAMAPAPRDRQERRSYCIVLLVRSTPQQQHQRRDGTSCSNSHLVVFILLLREL